MKILHTADLHLGKKLGKASRLDEQSAMIRELAEIAENNDVDVILIAGDIFDAFVPPSEAERLFYRGLKTLAKNGRVVIALAGNHDDERRLCAAKPLADMQGIVLAGELDYSSLVGDALVGDVPPASLFEVVSAADYLQKQRVKLIGHFGGVTIVKGEEKVNIALVPQPSPSRLARWGAVDYDVSYEECVKRTLARACEFFDDGYNILCTHLFITKSTGESLGGLDAFPADILPPNADYIALGHVHKYYTASKTPFAVYSGSPVQYAYDETRNKSVIVIDTARRKHETLPLGAGKKLTEVTADTFDECMEKLEFHKDDYVRIKYGGEPLGREETARIKEHPAFNDLVITASIRQTGNIERRAHLSDEELFELYYKRRHDTDAPSAVVKAFTELMEKVKN